MNEKNQMRVSPQESVEGPSKGTASRDNNREEKKKKEKRELSSYISKFKFPEGFIPKRKKQRR